MKKIFLQTIMLLGLHSLLVSAGFSEKLTVKVNRLKTVTVDSSFPKDMECIVHPFYRYRNDGKPGREISISFKDIKIYGEAMVDVSINGKKETTTLPAVNEGFSSCTVLLPENVGLEKISTAILTLRQGNNKLKKEIKVLPMRYWTVYLYNHSHVDIGYTNTQKNVEILHKNNILEGIKLAQATSSYPDGAAYKWNPEITWPLERLWNSMPEERDRVLNAISKGYLGIDASYLNLNTSVCADEELFHAFDFSRKIQQITGKPIDVFQQMDIPGITWGLVPVLAQQGIRYIMAWPNPIRAGNAHKNIDGKPFWWIGPDGKSKVLFFQPGGYANSGSMNKGQETGRPWFGQRDLDKVPAVIKTGYADVNFTKKLIDLESEKYPYDFLALSWTLWDNCPLDADIPDAVKAWNEKYAWPKIVISTGHEIMSIIEKKYGDQLPVVKGDYTEYWTDGLGSAAGLTAINRNTKEKLIQAEKLQTMLRPGKSAPREEFDEAWRYIALGSEHTWCSENPAEPFFQDAIWKVKQNYFREANERTEALYANALAPATDGSKGALGPTEGPSAGGIAVFNTNSWIHSGLITLTKAESPRGDRVVDEQGKDVPTQRLSTGELVFMAVDVPALGSRHFRVMNGKSPFTDGCKLTNTTIENQYLRLTIDPASGNITQLIDLKSGHNFADSKVNGGLNAFRWLPANIDEPKADTNIEVAVVESGPLVTELNVKSQGTGCRSVSRSVRLVAGQPWVEISNIVDKLPLVAKDGIHFGFGFNIPSGRTRVDIPWGIMEIEKDQWPQANRNWITMQRWLDISNEKEGVTWCSLDTPLFEYGKMSANIEQLWDNREPWLSKLELSSTIYSWVMNNNWNTNFPLTQDGPVTFRYRLQPHAAYDAVAANKFGMEQSQPLTHVTANNDPKTLPLVAVDNEKVCVTILKSLADGKGIIIRLRSLSDREEKVKLSFPAGIPKSVRLCTVDEKPESAIGENIVVLPYGMVTLLVEMK